MITGSVYAGEAGSKYCSIRHIILNLKFMNAADSRKPLTGGWLPENPAHNKIPDFRGLIWSISCQSVGIRDFYCFLYMFSV
jgi:hypothetical protein